MIKKKYVIKIHFLVHDIKKNYVFAYTIFAHHHIHHVNSVIISHTTNIYITTYKRLEKTFKMINFMYS